jgi:hypothetical protein
MARAALIPTPVAPSGRAVLRAAPEPRHVVSFALFWLFTLVLYLRPNDLLPIGSFPVVKVVGIALVAVYAAERFASRSTLARTPVEVKYLLAFTALMLLGAPLALNPGRAFAGITDTFAKVVIVFIVMVNVVTSRRRLHLAVSLVTLCGTVIAAGTIARFARGEDLVEGYRAAGWFGSMFGNSNDLAFGLSMLIPLAIGMAAQTPRLMRRLWYFAQAGLMTAAVFATFSRSGFITLAAAGMMLVLELKRRRARAYWGLAVFVLLAVLLAPEGFGTRITSLYDTSLDATGSLTERWKLVVRALETTVPNPKVWLVGIGVDNFPIVSIRERVNHNAYLQVLTEVGVAGFVVYMALLVTSIKRADSVASRRFMRGDPDQARNAALASSIKVALVAYAVGSLFASVAYLFYLYYLSAFALCVDRLATAEGTLAREPRRRR